MNDMHNLLECLSLDEKKELFERVEAILNMPGGDEYFLLARKLRAELSHETQNTAANSALKLNNSDFEKLLECLSLDEITKLFERVETISMAFKDNEFDSIYKRLALEISNRKKVDTTNNENSINSGMDNNTVEVKTNTSKK